MAIRYGRVYRGTFGYINGGEQAVIIVGRRALPIDLGGMRSVVGVNGSTRFKRLERRPMGNSFPPVGTPMAGCAAPPYSGHAKGLGPRMSQWGVDFEVLARQQRHQHKGARRARSHSWRQMHQRRACA